MSNSKKWVFSPKHCKGRKCGCRLRKKKHRNYLKWKHANLKAALQDKMSVVKVSWKAHYATITYENKKPVTNYCNYCYLRYQLRCRLFYSPSPFNFVNLYFFSQLERTSEGDFLKYYPNFTEKLLGKDQKEVEKLNLYLQSSLSIQDAKRLCK
jgi:hypothetical protein